jgi:hypothetical protein
MVERESSFLILMGGVVVVLALWLLSVLAVRWDTNRRGLSELERKTWMGLAILLPLFGFALYLALRLMRGYLAPPGPEPEEGEEERLTVMKPRAQPLPDHPPVRKGQPDVPEPAWGQAQPGRSNGGRARSVEHLPSTTPAAAQQPLRLGYALVALKGPHQGQQFFLNRLPVRIGRGPDVSIPLDADLNVSRSHAEIYEWNGRLRIRDLQSSHGTWVNDQAATDQAISPGDRIGVGQTVLVVRELE